MTPRQAGIRLSTYYAALFMTVGVQLPFWPLWLKDRGLSATEIGIILALTYLVKSVVNPIIGQIADRRGERRRPMIWLATTATIAWVGFAFTPDFWSILILTMVAWGLWCGVMPVGETLALMTTQRHGLDYGRVRLWGSVSFIVTATLCGQILTWQSPSILVWLVTLTLALTALSCARLPETVKPLATANGAPPLKPLVTSAAFLLFLGATSLNAASHTVYYAFSTIHWKAAGITDTAIGLLWSAGVVAEIVLFALSGRFVRKVSPATLLLLSGLAGILRWTMLATTTAIPALAVAQLLHGATFGCAHLGAMNFLRSSPPGLAARAQGIYAAVAMGIIPGLMSPLTGKLYDGLNGAAFLVMAALSAAMALAAWKLRQRTIRPQQGGSPVTR